MLAISVLHMQDGVNRQGVCISWYTIPYSSKDSDGGIFRIRTETVVIVAGMDLVTFGKALEI